MGSIIFLLALAAQAPAPPPPVDCNDANHRAFDFWVGEWDVSPTGTKTVVAGSSIEKIVGCAISESYRQTIGPSGNPSDYHGRSISSFVPDEGHWKQFYVDSTGAARTFTGGPAGGTMVFTAKIGGATARMTLSANADGSVRQHGERSLDGKAWVTTYDFTYRRR